MFPSFRSTHKRTCFRSATKKPALRRRGYRPLVERLEERAMLARFLVTTTADVVNPNDNVLSLREAIDLANNTPGADTIEFSNAVAGKTITLTQDTNDPKVSKINPNADNQRQVVYGRTALAITSDVTIDGLITLSGNNQRRLFVVAGPNAVTPVTGAGLSLKGAITITGGRAEGGKGGGGGAGLGGAIFVDGGSLRTENVTFTKNTARGGDGLVSTQINGGGGMSYSGSQTAGGGNSGFGGGGQGTALVGGSGGFGGGGSDASGKGGSGGNGGFGGGGGSGAISGKGGQAGFGGGIGTNAGPGAGAGMGGAIFTFKGGVNMVQTKFIQNTAEGGTGQSPGMGLGGAVFNYGGRWNVFNGEFTSNTATHRGGSIYNSGPAAPGERAGYFEVLFTEIDNGNAPQGAGLYNEGILNGDIVGPTGNTYSSNLNTPPPYVYDPLADIRRLGGGGMGNMMSSGGAIYNAPQGIANINQDQFRDNVSLPAGENGETTALINARLTLLKQLRDAKQITEEEYQSAKKIQLDKLGGGGAIYNAGRMFSPNSLFEDNQARQGGAYFNAEGGELTIINDTLINNTALINGGGIVNYGKLNIAEATLTGNDAGLDGGGVANLDDGELDMDDCELNENHADHDGGAIYDEGLEQIDDTSLTGNTSGHEGGGFHEEADFGEENFNDFTEEGNEETGNSFTVLGAGKGSAPLVQVRDNATGRITLSFRAYAASYKGGVRVAQGYLTGRNGEVTEVIVTTPVTGQAMVRIFDARSGRLIREFDAFPRDKNGASLALADVTGDGLDDIIVGAGVGSKPFVRVFDGDTGLLEREFLASNANIKTGVEVAAGDFNGDGLAEIVTAPSSGSPPQVKVFDGGGEGELFRFNAFAANFKGGVSLAVGDLDGDGVPEIIAGSGAGLANQVRIFDGETGVLRDFFAPFDAAFAGGVQLSARDVDGDGLADLIAAAGPNGKSRVRAFEGLELTALDEYFANSLQQGFVYVG